MLRNAKLYEDQIKKAFVEVWYDPDYQYYFDDSGRWANWCIDDCSRRMHFVSVDSDGNLLGYITYGFSRDCGSCYCFGAINFSKGNNDMTFAIDLRQCICDIFFKYNFNRIDFSCFSNNPALYGYRKFIERYGGREVGVFHNSTITLSGEMQNTHMFEVMKEDLIVDTKSGKPKLLHDCERINPTNGKKKRKARR